MVQQCATPPPSERGETRRAVLWTVKHTTRVGQRAVAQPDVDGRSGFLWGGARNLGCNSSST